MTGPRPLLAAFDDADLAGPRLLPLLDALADAGVSLLATATPPAPAWLAVRFPVTQTLRPDRAAVLASLAPELLSLAPHLAAYSLRDLQRLARRHCAGVATDRLLAEVRPSLLAAWEARPPSVAWDDFAGYEAQRAELLLAVQAGLAGRLPLPGVLVSGPPGSGKTLLVGTLAARLGLPFLPVPCHTLLSKYLGDSERRLRALFAAAREAAPCLLFFDEVDVLGASRTSGLPARLLAQLLSEADGLAGARLLLCGATSRPAALDAALTRPGRLSLHLRLDPPNTSDREAILRRCLRPMPAADVDVPLLAARTPGLTGAQLSALCQRAGLTLVPAPRPLATEDFLPFLPSSPSSPTPPPLSPAVVSPV